MSRASFSIRKLINQRRTWPDSDSDNEEAFECSSAKTIRLQYELEQYQQQQLQKDVRHQHKSRSSWMSSSASPKRRSHKRIPKPIIVVGHHSNDIVAHNGSTSQRMSTPLPLSSLMGRASPGTPHSLSSGGSLCSCPGGIGDCIEQHQRHIPKSKSATNIPSPYLDARLSTPTLTAGWVSPDSTLCPAATPTSTTKKSSTRKSSLSPSTAFISPNPCSPRGNQDVVSRQPRPASATPMINSGHMHPIRTPTNITPAPYTNTSPDRLSEARRSHEEAPELVRNAELYTLDSAVEMGDDKNGQSGARDTPRAVQPVLTINVASDATCDGIVEGSHQNDGEAIPKNVQNLIRETDEAFKAVGTALAEARRASQSEPQSKELQAQVLQLQRVSRVLQTQGLDNTMLQILPPSTYQAPGSRTRYPHGITSPISPSSGRGSILSSPRKSHNKFSPLSPSPDILRSPTRATSIKKAKRKSPSRPKASRPTATTATATGPSTPKAWPDLPSSTPKSSTFSPLPTREVNSSHSNSGHRPHHSYSRSLSRWNLKADNVTEKLFNGSRGRFGLHKIEADEVVTPGQVQQYRQSRIAKAQAEAQAETLRSNSNESLRSTAGSISGTYSDANSVNTPVEPFHLQDLPSRIGSSGVNLNVLSPVIEPSPSTYASAVAPAAGEHDVHMPVRSQSYPNASIGTPVQATHRRANSSGSHIPALESIPEVKVTLPQTHKAPPTPEPDNKDQPSGQPTSDASTSPYFDEDDEHIFLQSTPYTQTMPSFQHGRIQLAKADLINNGMINSFESKLLSSPDEGLDWTAYQMAILGGAGDLLSDPSDFLSRDSHEDLVDDLCDWLGDLGQPMGSLGTLVTEQEEKRRTRADAVNTPATLFTPASSYIPPPSQLTAMAPPGVAARSFHDPSLSHSINHVVSGDLPSIRSEGSPRSSGEVSDVQEMEMGQVQSMPIPISSEHPSGFWNTRPFDASRFFKGEGCGIKRWTLEGHPKRYQGPGIDPSPGQHGGVGAGARRTMRQSVDSLPQSPMLDLVMTTAVDGSKEFVPMGYNLGHDLGDFLKWETENVYATALWGTDY
ncbi:hypothetical protein VPNG_09057 [Cytospora leucostoma]|uniref:Uncharacterized protein n=1 Tax=Cytospora leucostoma TaxID=1230097 RepID=A0A423VZC4_9PEZI|nr:hypothetical protein VPNG_09057 [Cytospora leucostoma]